LTELFRLVRPRRVLEIGTSYGGTTQFIRETLNSLDLNDTIVRSYDVLERSWFDKQRNTGIDIRIENIFTHSYKELKQPTEIDEFIREDGVTVVLCDGGSKKNEFRLLSQFLKSEDIIMAHDYIDTRQNFEEDYYNKIWNWREIGDEDIQETCSRYNLVPFMQEEFNKAVWACRKKI